MDVALPWALVTLPSPSPSQALLPIGKEWRRPPHTTNKFATHHLVTFSENTAQSALSLSLSFHSSQHRHRTHWRRPPTMALAQTVPSTHLPQFSIKFYFLGKQVYVIKCLQEIAKSGRPHQMKWRSLIRISLSLLYEHVNKKKKEKYMW